jgi:hypothetical protein
LGSSSGWPLRWARRVRRKMKMEKKREPEVRMNRREPPLRKRKRW